MTVAVLIGMHECGCGMEEGGYLLAVMHAGSCVI